MKLNEILDFKNELYFDGAVQSEWFYKPEQSKKVAENFVFSSKSYFGIDNIGINKRIDTISLLLQITSKLNDDHSNLPNLVIADYGTGKSHLSVTMAHLFSGPEYMPETYNAIIQNIKKLDEESSKQICENCSKKNLVLVINGMHDFNLHSEILMSAQKSLLLYGVSDEKLKKINKSIDIAAVFLERNSLNFLSSFEFYAQKKNWNEKGNELIDKIRNNLFNDDAFDIVNAVYESINGHKIRWDEGISAGAILECLVNNYCGINGEFDSVIVLFDEFGRYLEYASVESGKSGDSALQQMFEICQNSEGKLQLINFIQSDIKTYLQRVDNTSNISRYIGRYDISDKYYISSNLETVFANLIQRKDNESFEKYIVSRLNDKDDEWKTIFNRLNDWNNTNGIWANYSLFRKVIVEGIYPMHPVSTYMLTQLSDYLQNRSSLTLVSEYVNELGTNDITDQIPLVLPSTLMSGDLFVEMLATEEEGKQSSQYCIQFNNILKKYQDKLSEESLKVLRSNLVLRVLRFRTHDYDDVLYALSICSGLSTEQIKDELSVLDNEYGVLTFDDRANCFDFVEEASGAYDYKIYKKRLQRNTSFNIDLLRDNKKIRELADVESLLETNFSKINFITSNEFYFTQELMPIEDFSTNLANIYIKTFEGAIDPTTPKGRLIWLYTSKTTTPEVIDNVSSISSLFENKPIKICLLNDIEDKLKNDLIEFAVLNSIDDSHQEKYYRHYKNDLNTNLDRIKSDFNRLKKERITITPNGGIRLRGKLTNQLDTVLSNIYTKPIPFNFEAFITKNNNVAPKQAKNYCTILRMLLCSDINSNEIHRYTGELRNKIDALFSCDANGSYKCINEENYLVEPQDLNVLQAYNIVKKWFNDEDVINGKMIIDFFTKPPYGMNTYSILLFVCTVIGIFRQNIRITLGNKMYSATNYAELLMPKEKLIFDSFNNAEFNIVDIEETEKKIEELLKSVERNRNIFYVNGLKTRMEKILEESDIPVRLNDRFKLAEKKLNDGLSAKKDFTIKFNTLKKDYDEMTSRNLYPGLRALEEIEIYNFEDIFKKYDYDYLNEERDQVEQLKLDIIQVVHDGFDDYLETVYCQGIEKIQSFTNHQRKMINKLQICGFQLEASKLQQRILEEQENIELIRARENIKHDVRNFKKSLVFSARTTYEELDNFNHRFNELAKNFNAVKDTLGKDAKSVYNDLMNCKQSIASQKEKMDKAILDIYDEAANINNISSANLCKQNINNVIATGLKKVDRESLLELIEEIDILLEDVKELEQSINDRESFKIIAKKLFEKYIEEDSDVLNEEIANRFIDLYTEKMDLLESGWKKQYIISFDSDLNKVYRWIENTRVLPLFLKEDTIIAYNQLLKEANEIISKNKILTAIQYYNQLTDEEKKIFMSSI